MTQTFHVVQNLTRRVILGRNWLQNRGVRVYNGLNCIRVYGEYIPLQEDVHITSVIRSQSVIKLPSLLKVADSVYAKSGKILKCLFQELMK